MIKSALHKIYLGFILLLLYAPILTLIVLSFNSSKTRSKWGGFSGKWYVALFQNEDIMNALYTTLIIALLSALIATIIGTVAAYRNSGIACQIPHSDDGNYQHSNVKCRYCNRYLSHAVVYCMQNPFPTVLFGIYHGTARAYYI